MSKLPILLLLLGAVTAERDTTPVFILDFEKILTNVKIEPNPFAKMKSSDFSKIIDNAIKQSEVVLVFVEESFCFEDISVKDKHGTPFYHLQQAFNDNQVKFLPSVSQPYGTLKQKFPHIDLNIFFLSDSNAKLKIYDKRLKYFYVYFKDSINETRANTLRRHDLSMKEVYFVVRQIAKSPIIAFYTGKRNPIPVEKNNFRPVKTYPISRQPGVTISSSGALFKFIGVYAMIGSRRSMFSQIPLIAEETWEKNRLNVRMAYTDFELEFGFDFKKDRWIVESVSLLEWGEEVGRTEIRSGAPWSWSYTCSEPIILVNLRDGSALTISHYQIQPFKMDSYLRQNGSESNKSNSSNNSNSSHKFGPTVNCGPYFNSHILAGLMVTGFFLGILTYGIVSMFNCYANDRYDDAHGKPLVIAFEGGS